MTSIYGATVDKYLAPVERVPIIWPRLRLDYFADTDNPLSVCDLKAYAGPDDLNQLIVQSRESNIQHFIVQATVQNRCGLIDIPCAVQMLKYSAKSDRSLPLKRSPGCTASEAACQ